MFDKATPQIKIELENATVSPGDVLRGEVVITLPSEQVVEAVVLEFIGSETASFPASNKTTTGKRANRVQETRPTLEATCVLQDRPAKMSGRTIFPFSYTLPATLPATFQHEGRSVTAKIEYAVRAKLMFPTAAHRPLVSFVEPFVLKTATTAEGSSIKVSENVTIPGSCCGPQTDLFMHLNAPKSVYTAGETVHVSLLTETFTESKSVYRLDCRVDRILTLNARGRTYDECKEMAFVSSKRLPAVDERNAGRILPFEAYSGLVIPMNVLPSVAGSLVSCRYEIATEVFSSCKAPVKGVGAGIIIFIAGAQQPAHCSPHPPVYTPVAMSSSPTPPPSPFYGKN